MTHLMIILLLTTLLSILPTLTADAVDFKIPQSDIDELNTYLKSNTTYHFTDTHFTSRGSPITLMMTVICNKKSSVLHNPIDRSVRQNCYIRPIPYLKVKTKLVPIENSFIESEPPQSSYLLSEKVILELKNYCFLETKQTSSSSFYKHDQNRTLKLTDNFTKTLKACAQETFAAAKTLRDIEIKKARSDSHSRVIFDNPYGIFPNEYWSKSDVISSLNHAIKEEVGHFDNNVLGYSNIGQIVTLKLECNSKVRESDNSSRCWFKTIDSFKFPKQQITQLASKGTMLAETGYMRIQAKCFLKHPVRSSELIHMNILGYDKLVNAPALKEELVNCVHTLYSSMQKIFKKDKEFE